jgi:hypothetical protein
MQNRLGPGAAYRVNRATGLTLWIALRDERGIRGLICRPSRDVHPTDGSSPFLAKRRGDFSVSQELWLDRDYAALLPQRLEPRPLRHFPG